MINLYQALYVVTSFKENGNDPRSATNIESTPQFHWGPFASPGPSFPKSQGTLQWGRDNDSETDVWSWRRVSNLTAKFLQDAFTLLQS